MTPGMTSARRVMGSNTRRSSWKGLGDGVGDADGAGGGRYEFDGGDAVGEFAGGRLGQRDGLQIGGRRRPGAKQRGVAAERGGGGVLVAGEADGAFAQQ